MDIGRADFTADGEALDAERQLWLERRQGRVGARPAGQGIDDQPDPVAALRLAPRQVDHMAEQPAEGGAENVQDTER